MALQSTQTIVKRKLSEWNPYFDEKNFPKLHLYNSLTRNKELFRPINGNEVKFYICGPTVYDAAHMGHARAYLSFDIVRRVLSNYFGYDVFYVMNVTDIDDKIIKRARQNYLYDQYVENFQNTNGFFRGLADDLIVALEFFRKKCVTEIDPDRQKMLNEMGTKLSETINRIEQELSHLSNGEHSNLANEKSTELLTQAKDILAEWLDDSKGTSVNELSVFSKLAKRFELDFIQDMETLNVLQPNVLTRVSEYVPEIIEFVEKIIKNGYAYETQTGSVYFDTAAFEAKPNHSYAKLVPESYGESAKHLKESEGELSIGEDKMQEKKSLADFALWKSSKSGEPFWESPWGKGRPGWHIECSAMSTAIFGNTLDIHAGGFDLKFPHHDNEIAQCEAYYNKDHWVNFFLHCGTLRIAGSKMSKSLKNFISIKQALKQYTVRQLRILFLMHTWTDQLDYSAPAMERVLQFEKFCHEFFLAVKDLNWRSNSSACYPITKTNQNDKPYSKREIDLLTEFRKIKSEIHAALCDSIDTRLVVEKVRELVSFSNVYIAQKDTEKVLPNCELLRNIAEYITSLLQMFGAIPENSQKIGFPADQNNLGNREELMMPIVNAFADFRAKVRTKAIAEKNVEMLKECDYVRDDVLPELGVRLEDKSNQTCVKLDDRETLLRERDQKRKVAEDKEAEKLRKQNKMAADKLAKQVKQKLKLEKEAEANAKKKNRDCEQ